MNFMVVELFLIASARVLSVDDESFLKDTQDRCFGNFSHNIETQGLNQEK